MSDQIDLRGEVALIIGGTKNIGLAAAQLLQRRGASVCVVGGSDAQALERALGELATGGRRSGMLADVADERAVIAVYEHAERELGPVTILVNGPGFRPAAPIAELSLESWSRVIDVMLTGPFLTSRELFRRLPDGRRGAIVNVGGLSAHRPSPNRAHVIAAKAGITGLTRALAEEGLGRIRANCVVPGQIETERKPGQPQARDVEGRYARGRSEDVARAVLFFADPRDVYVTGQSLHVSGGRFMP